MNQRTETQERFLSECDELLAALRSRAAIKDRSIEAMFSHLRELIEIYDQSESVPKSLAAGLFDMSTALYSALSAYPAEEQSKYWARFDEFSDLARTLLNED
jgi:plasmid stability protein